MYVLGNEIVKLKIGGEVHDDSFEDTFIFAGFLLSVAKLGIL